MQRISSIAIIGAGISGLALATKLIHHPLVKVTIFEKDQSVGGRVFTQLVAPNTFADLGANLIDFQSSSQEICVCQLLSSLSSNQKPNLQLFAKPFMIYEKGCARKGDYEKARYYYRNGFKQLVSDLQHKIGQFPQRCSLVLGSKITKIQRQTEKWLIYSNQQKHQFDLVVLSCNGEGMTQILSSSQKPDLKQLRDKLESIKYTKQISLAFQVTSSLQFSSILVKNHTITFICSHIQKYPQQIPIVVIQTNPQFSAKHFQDNDSQIEEFLRQQCPEFIKQWLGQCLAVKRWHPSLIQYKTSSQLKQRQQPQKNLFIVGDVFAGSSRVSNAIESSMVVSEMIKSRL